MATYAYDLNGNKITKTLENGTTASYIYDNASQLTRVKHMKSATNIAQFDYTLNAVGNRTAKNASGAIPNVNESYTYDAIDQVTAVSKPGDVQTFAYDPTGNRTAVTSTGSSPGVGSYTTNALNQYTAAAGDVLLYDTKGNLTTQGLTASYSYDSKNRLLGATKGSNTMLVSYDYRNRPVSRTINGTATYFIYDGWSLIGEYNVSGALLQKYIHGVNIDEILAKIDSTGTVFYHQDGLGSTVALTNSSGALLESYQYDVFGKATISDNSALPIASSAFSNRFMFTGREWIAEVGLYDYRNRVYSAELGRFIQSDPIRFDAGDVNIYRYVFNGPADSIDPLGLADLRSFSSQELQSTATKVEGGQKMVMDVAKSGNPQNLADAIANKTVEQATPASGSKNPVVNAFEKDPIDTVKGLSAHVIAQIANAIDGAFLDNPGNFYNYWGMIEVWRHQEMLDQIRAELESRSHDCN